ncbi:hypothetical protein [Aeromicrobium sp. UC242_57]|uniref:hypothetical protein n=1 Tax=Aeromicrobium sp. UC242_57 TaxID=3374624 RepID=UPI00378B4E71
MSITTRTRRGLATAIAAVLSTGGVVALAAGPAQADPVSVTTVGEAPITNATFTWGLSDEQGGGAYAGGCNFLSAGKAGNTGSSRTWTEGDGFYKTIDGNVTIEKPNASDVFSEPTWATKCLTPAGTPVTPGSTASATKNRVKISAGSGQLRSDHRCRQHQLDRFLHLGLLRWHDVLDGHQSTPRGRRGRQRQPDRNPQWLRR